MEKGKFSQPRPYRDEERQIEEAFRQITEQGSKKQSYQPKYAQEPAVPEETVKLDPEVNAQAALDAVDPVQEKEANDLRKSVMDFLFSTEDPELEENASDDTQDYPEESFDEEEPESLLDKILRFCTENQKWVIAGLCAFALVLIVSVICVFAFGGSGDSSEVIRSDIFVADINLRGRTRKQAISAVKQRAELAYPNKDMIVDLAGNKLTLSPKDTGVKLDAAAAVEEAISLDQTDPGNGSPRYIALLPHLDLNTEYILEALHAYAAGTGSSLTQTSYGLEGPAPALGVEQFREDSAQTLVITIGTPGVSFDVDKVYDQILDAYSMFQFLVTVTEVEPTVEPEPVDLQDIYEEFYVAPVDSKLNMQTFAVIPGSYGYEFDLLEAQKLLEQAQYGDVLRIPMLFIEPELLDEDTLFRDTLGEFQTALTSDRNRTTNIRLACEALNGTVLEPGESFSFNSVVGQPTSHKGYKTVTETEGGEEVETLGGGISQAATTLYNCALLADLEIVSRTNHSFAVDYVDYGLDAAAFYGGPDLKFRNNQNYPIRLEAAVSGNYVTIRILGTDERDYYVKMESDITATHKPATRYEDFEHDNAEGYLDGDVIRKGVTGYSVKSYKLKYDRQTGSLKSRDYEASSRYTTVDMLVARVAEPETTVPEVTAPETTVPEVTVPPTTIPPATEAPETVPQETIAAETLPPETEAPEQVQQETEPLVLTDVTEPAETLAVTE